MELLVSIIIVFIVTFAIFGIVDMIRQINKVDIETMGTIGTKPKTQTDYQREHTKIPPCVGHDLESQKENEKEDINFMYNWIREKSGKNVKDTKSTPH
jgi:hypothetical protein